VPAIGFYGGLPDLLVSALTVDWESVDDIRLVVALDSWQPTLGTRNTGHRNTARRLTAVGGKLRPVLEPPEELVLDLPEPFGRHDVLELPPSEVVPFPRPVRVTEMHSYMNQAPLRDPRDPTTPPPSVDESGRSPQTFLLDARVRRSSAVRHGIIRGKDIYAVTAP